MLSLSASFHCCALSIARVLVSVLLLTVCARCSDAVIVVRVVDDFGIPVSGALVMAGWNTQREPGNGVGAGRGLGVSGTTDKNGKVSLNVQGVPGVDVVVDGYYRNGIDGVNVMPALFTNPIFSLNSVNVDVVVSKVRKQAPMYVRKIQSEIPIVDGSACGFDLEIGDWIAPYGKGVNSDFIFRYNYVLNEPMDWDVNGELQFNSPEDGIIKYPVQRNISRNELRLPAIAPMDGYINKFEFYGFCHRGASRLQKLRSDPTFFPGTISLNLSSWDDNDNYIFRIRSKRSNSDGSIRAMYGKIHGPISIGKNGKEILFLYYLNPSCEMSLEWDTKTNLANKSVVPLHP